MSTVTIYALATVLRADVPEAEARSNMEPQSIIKGLNYIQYGAVLKADAPIQTQITLSTMVQEA